MTEHFKGSEMGHTRLLPGVFFFYDLSPIKVSFLCFHYSVTGTLVEFFVYTLFKLIRETLYVIFCIVFWDHMDLREVKNN